MTSPPTLLSVAEAVALVLARAEPLPGRVMSLPETHGLILDEPIVADRDSPPFTKSLMDGYAVRSTDLTDPGEHRLRVVAAILAGQTADRAIEPGETTQIMTGAPLPPGADAVVPVERTRLDPIDPGVVVLTIAAPVPAGQFRLDQGREMHAGDVLLEAGTSIRGAKLGLLAASGQLGVKVIPWPSIGIVPTGDELVRFTDQPGPGQIRETNSLLLAGLIRDWGNPPITASPIIPDDPDPLAAALGEHLKLRSVLIVIGGVSAGVRDLVPETLVRLGVQPVFHKVAVKPGKPIWFGVGPPTPRGRGLVDRPGTLVFGLPGNPVSGVIGFLLFVRPALDALMGRGKRPAPLEPARLAASFRHRGDRPTYHPVRFDGGRLFPLPWAGSADLRTVALADGFAAFAAGDHDYQAGDEVGFLRLG